MRPRFVLIVLLLCAGSLVAEEAPLTRIAVLPFANLSGTARAATDVADPILQVVRKKKFEIAPPESVAALLREMRIRTTNELSETEVRDIATALKVRYLLVGTIDRFQESDSSAEVTLTARLIEAETGHIPWSGAGTAYADPQARLLGIGRAPRAARLAKPAARSLLRDLRVSRKEGSVVVSAIRLPRHRADVRACRKVAIVTFGNESPTRFAGHIVSHQLLAALQQAGFEIIDPGRVRALMLGAQELSQGELSSTLVDRFCTDLSADLILTGTVSRFETTRSVDLDNPAVAFEARLIDARGHDLIWAGSFSREGGASSLVFGIGYEHSLSRLSMKAARELSHRLRALRVRSESFTLEQTR